MIAHHAIYGKVYKKFWIAAMIIFCWVFSYGMQIPTLLKVWGKILLTVYLKLREKLHKD